MVHAVANPERNERFPQATKVGFVVSRAVGSSVVRSVVKRRLRAVMAARLDRLPPDLLLVVRATPASALASSAELAADLDVALARSLVGLRAGRGEDGGAAPRGDRSAPAAELADGGTGGGRV
jgi:ribonuclease P protein component